MVAPRSVHPPLTDAISWVVGRGGLLGRGVETVLATRGRTWHPAGRFRWEDPDQVSSQLRAACHAFAGEVGEEPWQVAWCAGAGVVGSTAGELERETLALGHLLDALTESFALRQGGRGAMFLASSAGGVYAGSPNPPFREDSPVRPLAPYGENKLKQEHLAKEWSSRAGTPVLIGRISNLYGPGQNISKNQGLITTVCRRVLARQPLMLYVPLDTIRDYCYVGDASRLVADGLERLRREAIATDAATSATSPFPAPRHDWDRARAGSMGDETTRERDDRYLGQRRAAGGGPPNDLDGVARAGPSSGHDDECRPAGGGQRAPRHGRSRCVRGGKLGRHLASFRCGLMLSMTNRHPLVSRRGRRR